MPKCETSGCASETRSRTRSLHSDISCSPDVSTSPTQVSHVSIASADLLRDQVCVLILCPSACLEAKSLEDLHSLEFLVPRVLSCSWQLPTASAAAHRRHAAALRHRQLRGLARREQGPCPSSGPCRRLRWPRQLFQQQFGAVPCAQHCLERLPPVQYPQLGRLGAASGAHGRSAPGGTAGTFAASFCGGRSTSEAARHAAADAGQARVTAEQVAPRCWPLPWRNADVGKVGSIHM